MCLQDRQVMLPEWRKVGIVSKFLTGKPIGKRSLERFRLRWKDNIGMDLKEIGVNDRNWVD